MRSSVRDGHYVQPAPLACTNRGVLALYTMLCCFLTAAATAADAPQKVFSLTISAGMVPEAQRVLRVDKDDQVRLQLTGDVPGEVHLHGYRLEARVAPGSPSALSFRARATGRFRIEWHPTGETAKKGNHHGPPLANLEVHPK